jgi:glycosyltransferase involved in cell wall biosynthesis
MFLEMLCILLNKKVIAISQSVKRTLQKYEFIPERKIFVLTNGININEFRSVHRDRQLSLEKTIILGTVGRIEKSKGIKYLLFAMKRILAKYPNTRLEIVGDGSNLEDLKVLSKKLNISNSVKFFGKLANPIPSYTRMSIFIMPSVLEGFGIVLLEAMAAGVPVIATNVDGIKEVVVDSESGILIPPKNPDAIAQAVFKIIEQPELTMKLIEEGINRAKLFDVQLHLQKLQNFYYSLLGAESYR